MSEESQQSWDALYGNAESSRYENEGDVGIYYRLPKFVKMFKKHFSHINEMKILEV